ncbi:alpha/beta hydrolase [uncultured Arcticibacterium sp.]|uniref:alpha/beta hydrolase n=1 Tax=uncultured Arcticibacterium sp. TaxID=2173042 RepID=UPI0030F7ADDD
MKKILTAFVIIISTIVVHSQSIYSKAFGNPNDKPVIFLHGGPGYNAVGFESTTAQKLSENGFYVITYDRRGEGRSTNKNAKFTFDETFKDINLIYDEFNLTSATLIGHSFGGLIATLYAEKYPNKTESIVLVSAPLSMQETLSTILKSSKSIYTKNNDSVNLKYIAMLENMDKNSLEYNSYLFSHAMQNGFYYTKEPTQEAVNIYSMFRTDTLLIKYSSQMTYEAPRGFWQNEKYTSLDLNENLKQVIKNGTAVLGLYGKDDGLFSEAQIRNIESLIGENNMAYLDNCSHNLFIDQQTKFINTLKNELNNEF